MNLFEDIAKYLPSYLSAEGTQNLFKELEQFPDNIDGRIYSHHLLGETGVFQGDGLSQLWISNLPDPRVKLGLAMVVSNTCDISSENRRVVDSRLVYCPIVRLDKLEALVSAQAPGKGFGATQVEGFLRDVRLQRISSMFYLPKCGRMKGDSVALLDRMTNCDLRAIANEDVHQNRVFVLSDYGFYLFLFKLSIHLTRIRESVERH